MLLSSGPVCSTEQGVGGARKGESQLPPSVLSCLSVFMLPDGLCLSPSPALFTSQSASVLWTLAKPLVGLI